MVGLDSLSGLSGTQSQQSLQKATSKLHAAIASLASGSRVNKASDDVAAVAIATQLQSQTTALKQASTTLAQASSEAQVADNGLDQIQQELHQLQSIATQANSPVLSDSNRKALDDQFQQIKKDIDRIASNTAFNGQKLLNGDLSGDKAISVDQALGAEGVVSEEGKLSIVSVKTPDLFGGKNLSVVSGADASQSVVTIGDALNQITSVRASVGAFQKSVDYAAASIDSALANQQAAQSVLSDTDFATASTEASSAKVQRDAALAVAAQGNRLSPALLKLVS